MVQKNILFFLTFFYLQAYANQNCLDLFEQNYLIQNSSNVHSLPSYRAEQRRLIEQEKLQAEKEALEREQSREEFRQAILAATPGILAYRRSDISFRQRKRQLIGYVRKMSDQDAQDLITYLESSPIRQTEGFVQHEMMERSYPIPRSSHISNAAFDVRTNLREVFLILRDYDAKKRTTYALEALRIIMNEYRFFREHMITEFSDLRPNLSFLALEYLKQNLSIREFYEFLAQVEHGKGFFSHIHLLAIISNHIGQFKVDTSLNPDALNFEQVLARTLYLNIVRWSYERSSNKNQIALELIHMRKQFELLKSENLFLFHRYQNSYASFISTLERFIKNQVRIRDLSEFADILGQDFRNYDEISPSFYSTENKQNPSRLPANLFQ